MARCLKVLIVLVSLLSILGGEGLTGHSEKYGLHHKTVDFRHFDKSQSRYDSKKGNIYDLKTDNAEQAPFRIFMIMWDGPTEIENGFLDYLKKKRVHFVIEQRDCKNDPKKCHSYVQDIRAYKPDLLYIWGAPAAEAIVGKVSHVKHEKKNYIWDIPTIVHSANDLANSKVIYSNNHPRRNVTGVSELVSSETQLQGILLYKKETRSIAVLYNPLEINAVIHAKSFRESAESKGIKILELPLGLKGGKPDVASITQHIQTAHDEGADFIFIPFDVFLAQHSKLWVEAANKYKIPTCASTEQMYWDALPLLGVISHFYHIGQFGAHKAFQILIEGKSPENIPYEPLTRVAYMISKPTFEAIGFPPPLSLLSFAEIREHPMRE